MRRSRNPPFHERNGGLRDAVVFDMALTRRRRTFRFVEKADASELTP
jgi:hypothetical protein